MTLLNITPKRSKSFDESGAQFAWDSTSIKLAETCLRKYKLKMIDGWQPIGKGVHLRFGGHYATAIEHYYKHKVVEGMDHDAALEAVVLEALCDTWEYEPFTEADDKSSAQATLPNGRVVKAETGAPWDSLHNLKTRATLIRTIIWYLEQFKDDPATPITLSSGKPAVELSFTLPVGDDVILAGHLDRLAEYADNIYVMDEKTTGTSINSYYFDQFSPDTQMSLYTYAGQVIWNVPVKGVVIDAAQIAVGFTRFERGMTMRTQGQLNEWFDNTMYRIADARKATLDNYFPMNPSSCGNFGGCEFRGICSLDPNARERFLKADFVQGPVWDPLERR